MCRVANEGIVVGSGAREGWLSGGVRVAGDRVIE